MPQLTCLCTLLPFTTIVPVWFYYAASMPQITVKYLLRIYYNVIWSDSPTRTPPRSIFSPSIQLFVLFLKSQQVHFCFYYLLLDVWPSITLAQISHSSETFQMWLFIVPPIFVSLVQGCQCYRELTLQNSDHIWVLLKCLMENRKPP